MSWETLRVVTNMAEAALIEGSLESSGIEVEIESRAFSAEPVNVGNMAQILIRVQSHQIEEAQKLLEELAAEAADEAPARKDDSETA